MDGVIVDSTAMHIQAWEVYLKQHGLAAEELGSRMLGKHNDELVRELFPRELLNDDLIYEHGLRKEALYREMISPVLGEKLVPGVRDFILRHSTKPLGIATNAEPANVDLILDFVGLRSFFRAIVNGHDVARPKPFPDIYLRAAGMLGYAPPNCVVFEDSMTGVKAAREAGAKVVGISTTLSTFTDVDLTISDFMDPRLEPWLQELTVSR
jgi:HAD superfamily hydrolase (TIGR01509 family)